MDRLGSDSRRPNDNSRRKTYAEDKRSYDALDDRDREHTRNRSRSLHARIGRNEVSPIRDHRINNRNGGGNSRLDGRDNIRRDEFSRDQSKHSEIDLRKSINKSKEKNGGGIRKNRPRDRSYSPGRRTGMRRDLVSDDYSEEDTPIKVTVGNDGLDDGVKGKGRNWGWC